MIAQPGRKSYKTVGLAVVILLMAVIPRVWALDVFVTPDEFRWVQRSIRFLTDLLTMTPRVTIEDGIPGVTTRWTGVAGLLLSYSTQPPADAETAPVNLLEFITTLEHDDFGLLPTMRLPTVIVTALCVVVLYLLVRRLFGESAALVAGVLLALDPFFIGLSRVIHTDALVSSFIGITVLSLLAYLSEERPPLWLLLLSGIAAGLALLSKSTALFLLPYAFLVAAASCLQWDRIPRVNRTSVRRALLGLIGWGLIAALVVVALWPAMWVDPSGALNEVLGLGTYFATTPHESGNYFLGQPTDDPGLLFYPLAFLFRITPLMLIGILASWLLLRSRERRSMGFYLFALWSFILLFMAFVSLGVKKFDRYALPTILLADVLAGAGLACLLAWLRRRLSRPKLVGGLGLALVLILQVALLWPHVPYYLTYYNPLLGGGQGATAAIMVGWGEGCDLAARYLNRKEHAAGLDVVTRYPGTCFGALFEGTAWDTDIDRGLGDQEGTGFPWYAADYVVLYVNQVQRNLPSRAFVAFFQAQEPEYVAHIAGLPYAWVYRMPATIPDELPPAFHTPVHKVPAGNFADQVWLANYAICDTAYQEKASFTAGETVHLILRWRTERLLPVQYKVFAHVYDDQGQLITQADDALGGPKAERLLKKSQNKIMNYLTLPLPSTMPPGTYRIAIGLYDEQTGARLPRADGAGDHILLDATITVQGP